MFQEEKGVFEDLGYNKMNCKLGGNRTMSLILDGDEYHNLYLDYYII
jgi:hypothetical protein